MAEPAAPTALSGEKMGYGHTPTGTAAIPRIVNPSVAGSAVNESGAQAVASMVLHDAADDADEGPVKIGGVAKATAPTSVADGDRVQGWFDVDGAQMVKVRGIAALDLGKAEDAVHVSGDTGVMALAVRKDTAAQVAADGDYHPFEVDANGRLHVIEPSAAGAAASLALLDDAMYTDDAGYTPGTSKFIGVGMQADESSTDSVDEGDVGMPRMTLDRKQIVVPEAHTAGGATPYSALSTAAVLNPEIKGSPGQVYGIQCFNDGANKVFIRVYNQTGAPATTDGANIVWRGMIPGNTAAAGHVVSFPVGLPCGTGIGIRVTGAVADNDATALAANEVMINLQYK